MVLAYQGVKLEKDNIETASMRTFLVPKQLSEKEMMMEVVQCIGICGISDYPYKSNSVNNSNFNEITASWYPGSIIGYNFSGKMGDSFGVYRVMWISRTQKNAGILGYRTAILYVVDNTFAHI